MAVFVFIGMLAVVLDISWYWINSNRVQKAADAAALAGVVWLPGDEPKAIQTAIYEAAKNGYTVAANGVAVNGLTLTAAKQVGNDRRLNVSIRAPVGTFFMRLFGLNTIMAARSARAEYVLPVAMGSPENYYGVFGQVRNATMTTTTTQPPDVATIPASGQTGSGQTSRGSRPGTAVWTTTSGTLITAVLTDDTMYARTSTNNAVQQWGNFGLTGVIPANSGTNPTLVTSIVGIVVTLDDVFLSGTCANSTVGAELSWNGGSSWSTQVRTSNLATSTTGGDYTLGVAGNTTAWGAHSWLRSEFTDANFRIRLQALKGCGTAGITFNVDRIRVQVYYRQTQTTTYAPVTTTNPWPDTTMYGPGAACANGVVGCYSAQASGGGQTLNPRGFWATMNTQGAWNLNGDAFQPYYDNTGGVVAPACPTPTLRACYDKDAYYNYAVEMPPGSTGGYVYIFDPVFCETAVSSGTGDRHFNGNTAAVRSFYELYDTGSSLFTQADDTLIVSSGNTFTGMANADTSMGGSSGSECRQKGTGTTAYGDARDFHNSWYLLNPANPLTGGANGTTYRVHTTSTDPSALTQQQGDGWRAELRDLRVGEHVAEGLWPGCDADVHAAVGQHDPEHGLHLLPGADRRDPCREDARTPSLGPGRHRVADR